MEGEKQSVKVITKKSPQELAAQMGSVFSLLDLPFPLGREIQGIGEKYQQAKKHIEQLQTGGADDTQLSEELERLYQEGIKFGIYAIDKEAHSQDLFQAVKGYYLEAGRSEPQAEKEARDLLKDKGYLVELRKWRRRYEEGISGHFDKFISDSPMNEDEEKARIRKLSEKCIFISQAEQSGTLGQFFPGGNFLYHGTGVEGAMQILFSGDLANYKAIWEKEEERVKLEERERKPLPRHSGFEGISWNFNEIGALPGDRYHLVGFLTSPVDVLTPSLQLAIPSRPAPNELILINGDIDSRRFYELKTQFELLADYPLIGEENSVISNIFELTLFKKHIEDGKGPFRPKSMLNDLAKGDLTDEEMAVLLKGKYRQRTDGTVEFAVDLLQQVQNQIPAGAVWLQALIDSGRIQNIIGFEDVITVRQAIDRIREENWKNLLPEWHKDRSYIGAQIESEENKMTPISIPISDMYLVVPDADLNCWLKVLARCDSTPKGILVYERSKVRLENFATLHRGDNEALTRELKLAIPPSQGYIDYEEQLLGERITPEKMAGHRKHVIGEQFLGKRKALRKNTEGNLVVI